MERANRSPTVEGPLGRHGYLDERRTTKYIHGFRLACFGWGRTDDPGVGVRPPGLVEEFLLAASGEGVLLLVL
jgi:hypothetical protein